MSASSLRRGRNFDGLVGCFGRLAVAAALLLWAGGARAQETKGSVIGHVTDGASGKPVSGLTVILQGPQGEDGALTNDAGDYEFHDVAVGSYVVRFYSASAATNVERDSLSVTAGSTARADAVMPTVALASETYVIKKKVAAIDVGTARLGATFDEEYMANVPVERTYGDLLLKAPGAFLESSGSVSVAGASGLENIYVMDGLNVTGMDMGDIMNRKSDAQGGSNLTLEFIKELQLNTGGYRAEYGGAMGGVVNVVTKSGTNEWRGSAFGMWSPYWLSATPKSISRVDSALVGVDKPDYDTNVGVEVGGPLIKDKLFMWVGFAPRLEKSHYFRDAYAFVDANGDGVADTDPKTGDPARNLLLRTRTPELRQSYQYGAKIDYNVAPEHHLTVGLFGTPSSSRHVRNLNGLEALGNPGWAEEELKKNNTDLTVNWTSRFFDGRWRIEATLGLHREDFSSRSPNGALNATNDLQWIDAHLSDFESIQGCEVQPNGFDPCPVSQYHSAGFGLVKQYVGNRWSADVKSTHLLKMNELKFGAHVELNTMDQSRYLSGPTGNRNFFYNQGGTSYVWNLFSLPRGTFPSDFGSSPGQQDPAALLGAPYHQEELDASVKSVNIAYFLQDSFHPIQNVTIDLGLRLENQRMYDFRGDEFLNLYNWGPRVGVIYDPSGEGRSKLFANYGKFYETIPLNLATRYFGGEGIIYKIIDNTKCPTAPSTWTGKGGESEGCPVAGYYVPSGGGTYPVQPSIRGQYHNEIVAGFQQALNDDLVVGVDYTHRWLGDIIEDGATNGDYSTFVLANPGQIPQSSLDQVRQDVNAKQAALTAYTGAGGADPARLNQLNSDLGAAQAKLANLTGLAAYPKPERTYDAITLSASKRLAKGWMVRASYTYSRLIGNYNGLYDVDNNYAAPNGNNAYDYPELVPNKRGPLANDRPHSGHVDGFYQLPVGPGTVTLGGSFSAYSGIPRNYVAAFNAGNQLVFLLPRGSAGRTPTITQLDFKVGYRQQITKMLAGEVFLDIYNILDQRTATAVDDNYTFSVAAPIVNGNTNDLKYARDVAGAPITLNTNFGKGTAFQAPTYGRMGLRLIF